MLEAVCVILGFLILYLIHNPEDSLNIVRLYRTYTNLPYVEHCYHNHDKNPQTSNSLSNRIKNRSTSEKLTKAPPLDSKERESNKENNSITEMKQIRTEPTQSTNRNLLLSISDEPKSLVTKSNLEDNSQENSVYLSSSMRKQQRNGK